MLQVGELVTLQLGFRLLELRLYPVEAAGDRRQVGVALGELRLQGGERLADLRLLPLQGLEMLLLLSLLLLQLVEAVRERVRIIRLRRQRGEQEQQRQGGARCFCFYSGGAPAEPGMPGSRRGVKVTPPNGGLAALGFFSFFFFFSSRRPRSRDLAMVPASQSVFGEWLL